VPSEPVELPVYFADWSDPARAGMIPPGGEATLTAVLNDAGRLSLYLERGARGSLLHIEVTVEHTRKLYNFLQAQCGGSSQQQRGRKRSGRMK
jgi:hypothetical protein